MNLFNMFRHAFMNEEGGDTGNAGGGTTTETKPSVKVDEGKKAPETTPAPKPEPGDAEVLSKAGFESTEDKGLNYALTFLARHGFTADNPAVGAAFEGDFSMLKAELAQKGVQGWEQALGLGEQAYARLQKENEAAVAESGKIALEIAERSGVDWEAAVQHTSASASPEIKTALNDLLRSPATAAIAAGFITNSYLEGSNEEVQPRVSALGDQVQNANRQVQGGPLSRQEYTKEMAALRKKLGDDYLNSPEAQALYARRRAGN